MEQRIKFKYFENKQTFDQNTCDPSDLCFIEDTKEIWSHGTYFDCKTFDPSSLEASIQDILQNKQDAITDLVTIRNNAAKGASALQSVPSEYITETELVNKGYATTSAMNTELGKKQDTITDLAAIRSGAAKGATALQSYTEQYKGTVTSVTIDNINKTPSSGNVNLGYVNKQLSTSTSSSMTLSPNIYYRNTSTSLSTLTITLGSVSNSNIINEYFVEFTTRSSGTTVSLPSTIKWTNGETPTFEASTTYQISIINNLGVVTKFK